MASLGFDFGTSNTFIVKRANNGNLTVLNWSSGANSYYERSLFDDRLGPFSSVGIPTRIGYAGTDSEGNKIWKVGAQTAGIDERNVCTDLKTKINDTIYDFISKISQNREFEIENMQEHIYYGQTFTDAQTGESFYMSAIELSKIFLTEVLKKQDVGLTSILLGQDTNPYSDIMDVDCIVIGVPSNDRAAGGDIQVSYDYSSVLADKIFKPVVDSIFGEDNSVRIAVGAEPILAANAYIKKYPNSTNIGDYILVVDIGGGTSDYALIKRTRDSYEVVYHTEGGDRPAGHSFDVALRDTLEATGESFSKIQIRLAKENLFPSFDAYCRINELDKANPRSRIMYAKQYESSNCAPSSIIRSDNGREYKVVFENNAFYNNARLNYYDEFSHICNGMLSDKVRSYLESFKKKK